DRIHAMDVRTCAEAPAARLDSEQVAEQRDDEGRVEQLRRMAQSERDDRQPLDRRAAEDLDVRGPALLSDHRMRIVGVTARADEEDGSASRYRRHAIVQEAALDDQHAGCAGAADELVR